jgi:hypothetical protein
LTLLHRFSIVVVAALAICLTCQTIARADSNHKNWAVAVGPGIKLSDQDSDFGFSAPFKATLDYFFGDDDDWYGYGDYEWSTSDDLNSTGWGLGVGARTPGQDSKPG